MLPLKGFDEKDTTNAEQSFFYSLFPKTILDSHGRIRCVIPSALDADMNSLYSIAEHNASDEYLLYADFFIKRYLLIAQKYISFNKENLEFLVKDNIFIPEGRAKTYLDGLVAGFNLDLSTSMHLLMPQVENSIRYFAELCDAVTYKTHENGVEECLSLDGILKLPEVEECFDEKFLFNLKLFFTSDYGFGMRSSIAHGLFSDDELQSAQSLAVWWFVLHICCMYSTELYKRLNEQYSKDKK